MLKAKVPGTLGTILYLSASYVSSHLLDYTAGSHGSTYVPLSISEH